MLNNLHYHTLHIGHSFDICVISTLVSMKFDDK